MFFFDGVDTTPLMCLHEMESEYKKLYNSTAFPLVSSKRASVYQFNINFNAQSVKHRGGCGVGVNSYELRALGRGNGPHFVFSNCVAA